MRILAHAFGQRYELPIPLLVFVFGGATVVLLSFMLTYARPVRAREDQSVADVPTLGPLRPVRGSVATMVLLALVACGFLGSQVVAENIVPTLIWLIVWILVPLSVGVLGDWTRSINPFAFLSRLTDRPALRKAVLGSPAPVAWPSWLGWWPAVVLFFIAASGELVFNLTATVPRNTALALVIYAVVCAFCGMFFGRRWLERGELFTVLYSTWGRLGYFRFGSPGRRGFAGGLEVPFAPAWSRLAFVLMLLVSVNFDGLLATPRWAALERRMPGNIAANPAKLEAFRTLTFVLLGLALALLFGMFASAAAGVGRRRSGPRATLTALLPSLLPIAFGYLLAHNIEYLVVNSQLLLPLLGNPAGLDWWPSMPYPFNDSYEVHTHLLPNGFYWYISLVVIVAVHVIAVILAHRSLGPDRVDVSTARSSEYPWLVAMVGYTMFSLWLLAQPLVTERGSSSQASASASTCCSAVHSDVRTNW